MLSGHDRGSAARTYFDLPTLERNFDHIVLVVPKDLDAITPSFIQGMFALSATLDGGKDAFLQRYDLRATEWIREDILAGIDRLLMKRSVQ